MLELNDCPPNTQQINQNYKEQFPAYCGAAAESILLATAIKKTSNENNVLNEYCKAGGRRKIDENKSFLALTSLLRFARFIDENMVFLKHKY